MGRRDAVEAIQQQIESQVEEGETPEDSTARDETYGDPGAQRGSPSGHGRM